MKNLTEQLLDSGLTREQAIKAIEIVHEWVNTYYPVLGAVARPLVQSELSKAELRDETEI